ncbi:MAG: SDR family oxidoreductase [Burkholderiaceae bacterium]|nr:SDR family oxidoreductase [Burkholderiaceae bacterium]
MDGRTILVLGAGGNVGRPLVRALRSRGETVRAASRSGAAVEGAEGVAFDITQPQGLTPALEGVSHAYLMLPAGHVQARDLLLPVVQALAGRGIKTVFQSVFGVDADDAIPYRQVELALQRSGTAHVILRPNWFADNFHTYWQQGVARGLIAVPAGQGRSSFIDVRDIAASAVAALTGERFDGQAFNLTGPEALDYGEAAQVLARVLGRSVSYRAVDDADFVAELSAAGVAPDYAGFLASIFHPVREGWTAAITDHVQLLTGRPPRTLRIYAEDHAAELAA